MMTSMRVWDDTLITVRGNPLGTYPLAGAIPGFGGPTQEPIPATSLLMPLGRGAIVRWYWVFVAAFFAAYLLSMPMRDSFLTAGAVACLIAGTVLFGSAIQNALGAVWPWLRWVLLGLLLWAAIYPFAKDINDGKFIRGAGAAESGIASVYSTRESGGSRTASGVRLNDGALTAAHKSLPFGSKVKVTNHRNGKSVVVTITDRGPFVRGRIIDLTVAAASALGFSGLAPVTVERVAS